MNTNRFKFRVFLKKENRYAKETGYDEQFWIGMDGRLYVDDGYDRPQFINYPDDKYKEGPNNIEDLIVEQCTGLKDADGNLIYEGDILQTPSNTYFVRHDEKTCGFVCEYRPSYRMGLLLHSDLAFKKYRIVGNIHENPELLEEQK